MQFAHGYSSVENPRPSVFGPYVPTGFIGNDGSASWLQVPPSQMPWGIPTSDQPAIVRFTAESSHLKSSETSVCSFTQPKRKLDEEDLTLPVKQHISEEKMAAHLSQLHISSDYTTHQAESREDQQQQLKRLVLCDEIRKLKQEPILPSSLLSRLEKPSMALVLWQPPAGNINPLLRGNTSEEDNNNTSVVDLNALSAPEYVSGPDSMMDL